MTVSKPDVVPRMVPRHVSSVPIPIVDALEKLLEIENINCVYFRGHRAFESLEWAYGELQSRTKFQTCEIRLIRKAFQFDTAMLRINSNANRIEHVEFAAWNDDELIEYLLAKYPTQCKRLMAKIALALRQMFLCGGAMEWLF